MFSGVMSSMETYMKVWNILGHRFRHDLEKHGMVFRAIATIEQLKMDNGHPMFQVVWEDYGLGVLEMAGI